MGNFCTTKCCNNNYTIQNNAPRQYLDGARFMSKSEAFQLQNNPNINVPPKDIEGLKAFYEAISRMQMEDPENVYLNETTEEMTQGEGPPMPQKMPSSQQDQPKLSNQNHCISLQKDTLSDNTPQKEEKYGSRRQTIRYQVLDQKRKRNDSSKSNNQLRERMKGNQYQTMVDLSNQESSFKYEKEQPREMNFGRWIKKSKEIRSSSQNMQFVSSGQQMIFNNQQDSNSQDFDLNLKNQKFLKIDRDDNFLQSHKSLKVKNTGFYESYGRSNSQQFDYDYRSVSRSFGACFNADEINLNSQYASTTKKSSFFAFGRNNAGQIKISKPKQNMKFFTEFKEAYDEISRDLLSRVEELQELHNTSKIAHEFQFSNKRIKKSLSFPNLEDIKNETIQKSILELMGDVNWEDLVTAEKLVEQFLQDSQIYFDQAQHAVTKQKERELLTSVYEAIKKIDRIIGQMEIEANFSMREVMNNFVDENIKQLASTLQVNKDQVIKSQVTKAGTISQSSADHTPTVIGHDDLNQNLVNQIIDYYNEEMRSKFEQKSLPKLHYKDFLERKMSKVRDHLAIQIQQILAELKTLQKTSNPNLKKQQHIMRNTTKLKDVVEDLSYDLIQNYSTLCMHINKQFVDIHKEKHLYQIWKVQQIQSVTDQNIKKNMVKEIMNDLNHHISYIDYEFEEMKDQQLCVDMSIEQYYKKIQNYPKGLKRLFDMGTQLLHQFEQFYQGWYGFQCEVQQKLYNQIFSQEQDIILSQLQTPFQIKQLENIVLKFHTQNEEFLKIKSNFYLFTVEIMTQNQVLFKNSTQITNDCLAIFERLGVMDTQGVGQLIKSNSYESDIENQGKTQDNSADHLAGDNSYKIPKKPASAISTSSKLPPPKYCLVDEQAKELCLNISTINDFQLTIHQHYEYTDDSLFRAQVYQPSYFNKNVLQSTRHCLKFQMNLTYQQFLAQQFDQIYSYSQIQNFIMSAEHSVEKDKQTQVNNSFIHNIDKPELPKSKDSIEFDLIITICGIDFNIISLKKQIKTLDQNIPNRGETIYRRELFMNLNYLENKKKTNKSEKTQNQFNISLISPTSGGLNALNPANSSHSMNSVTRVINNVFKQQNLLQMQAKEKEADDNSKYLLIPLGIAMHHLTESEEMISLFDGLKNLSLNQIDHIIKQIENQIDSGMSRHSKQKNKSPSATSLDGSFMSSVKLSKKHSKNSDHQKQSKVTPNLMLQK